MLTYEQFNRLTAAFAAKDLPTVMSYFAADAVLIDPHYPQPRMAGRSAIERGLRWGLGKIEKSRFVLRRGVIDGDVGFFEVDTHHRFKGGLTAQFDQVFVVEMSKDKIIRLQAYVPYPPPGMAGLLLRITRWIWKCRGKNNV